MRKKRITKKVVYLRGGFVLWVLLRFENTIGLVPLGALPSREHTQENTLV
jgi:hypothetical protein